MRNEDCKAMSLPQRGDVVYIEAKFIGGTIARIDSIGNGNVFSNYKYSIELDDAYSEMCVICNVDDIIMWRPATDIEKQKLIDAVEKMGIEKYNKETKEWDNIRPIPKVEKPPLGLMPLSEHNRLRQEEIMSAIERYEDAGLKIPIEWLEEMRDLVIYDVETAFGASNNDKVVQFRVLADELSDLYKQKNEAYGDSFGKSVERYGKVSALTRMSDKWNRLENLMLNEDIESGDESVIDTLKDLASYCLMTIIELKKK